MAVANATTDTDRRRIPFSLHFGQLRASNYRGNGRGFGSGRYSRVHAKHVSDIAAACFSFSAPRRPGNDVIRHCRFHCDSRIAVYYLLESANSAVLDCASAPRHSNSAVLLLALIGGPGIHKFLGVYEDPLDVHAGTSWKVGAGRNRAPGDTAPGETRVSRYNITRSEWRR